MNNSDLVDEYPDMTNEDSTFGLEEGPVDCVICRGLMMNANAKMRSVAHRRKRSSSRKKHGKSRSRSKRSKRKH